MSTFTIKNRIWIEKDGQSFIGQGKVQLLELIDTEGSINKAAKKLGMSYKRAWIMVEAMNALAEHPLVERMAGGHGGGGTKITDSCRKILEDFHRIQKHCQNLIDMEIGNCRF